MLPTKSSKNFTIGPKSGGLFEFCTSAGLIKKSGGLLANPGRRKVNYDCREVPLSLGAVQLI